MIDVLFICLGNICRSPMAEAVLKQLVDQAGLAEHIAVDSVGTGAWHIGEPPHPGTQAVLGRNGVPFAGAARQLTKADLDAADYLIAMDADNVAEVRRLGLSDANRPKLRRLMEFAPADLPRDVPDPWFTGDFDETYRLVSAGCRGLLEQIRREHDL
jgi:protein-tyrosine phosphatase